MKKYRKKPVIIEAIQYRNDPQAIMYFVGHDLKILPDKSLVIKTLEGDHKANIGDWIIKGIKGEFYPVKDDIFLATYEKVIDK